MTYRAAPADTFEADRAIRLAESTFDIEASAAKMREMGHKGLGAVAIVDAAERVLGIFTDGGLRRLVEKGDDLRSLTAAQAMHADPHVIAVHALAVDAARSWSAIASRACWWSTTTAGCAARSTATT